MTATYENMHNVQGIPPSQLCLKFLDRLGSRDLDGAKNLVAPDFRMTFPGGRTFTRFEDMLAWAAPRYRTIAKQIDRIEDTPMAQAVAVFVSGTLSGERPDGTVFKGIRFIDRFEVHQGLIRTQEVWNDLAETGLTATAP